MREIARDADVSKALIHYHFDSKESLFLEMLGHLYREVAADVQAIALDKAQPGLEAAETALEALSAAMSRLAPLTPVFAEVGVVALRESRLRERTQMLLSETRKLVELGILQVLGEDDVERLPDDLGALATLMHSCLHGIALSGLYDDASMESQMNTFRRLILAALRAQNIDLDEDYAADGDHAADEDHAVDEEHPLDHPHTERD